MAVGSKIEAYASVDAKVQWELRPRRDSRQHQRKRHLDFVEGFFQGEGQFRRDRDVTEHEGEK